MNQNEADASSNVAPILGHKSYAEPAVFTPANLLREARRQKSLAYEQVPRICVLDPDGDIVEHLRETGCAEPDPYWACYHTRLYNCTQGDLSFGIIGRAVGAPFAVLVAEELFASGCRFVESCAGGCASRRALRDRLDEPDEYCPVVRGEDEVRRVQEMLNYTLSNPEDVPKAGNACTTVIKTAVHLPE